MRHNCVISPKQYNLTIEFRQYCLTEGITLTDDKSRYTLRIEPELLRKLGYIAEYEGRTKNRELEQMIKKRIAEFEREHGPIADEDEKE